MYQIKTRMLKGYALQTSESAVLKLQVSAGYIIQDMDK